MNPIERALVTADKVIAANADLERITRENQQQQSRSYVVGLPVVVTVNGNGTVTVEVDLSEASDAPFDGTPTFVYHNGEWVTPDHDEDILIADREAISAAQEAGTVTVTA